MLTLAQLPLLATILLLLPMVYFAIASLTFFIARLRDPVVTRVLRGLFDSYFLGLIGGSAAGVLAFGLAGRLPAALVIGSIGTGATLARRWFLRRLDLQVLARDAGDAAAIGRLRRLHVGGILYNAAHLVALVASIPQAVPLP
ncbi:hypothetical protein [Paracraurococcus ruber]|uniref:Uncharacterized protein n=1 Tax=Paracraurococcus ruber TaxID=77675 RepID=A0ABS1D576_9PROT|nr:hypothetical protein [Paracraurococcus ruber]MBK1661919.1 hypothetical protein [Paracraurococcus ruber]TDG16893.1 hypothetical protein E2C05_28865 [Paracraurococcus ruber]